MTYFANKYAPDSTLYPSNPQERAIVDRVLQFDLGTFYRSLGEYLVPILREGKTLDNLDPEKEKKVKEALQLLDDSLAKHTYVAGDKLTLADLSILASLTFAEVFDYDVSSYKNVKAWTDRLKKELPYYDEVNTEPITLFKSYVKVKTGERKPE
jgi:glutathione S-transferase